VTGSCEHGSEPSVFIKCEEFLDQMSVGLKENSSPWSGAPCWGGNFSDISVKCETESGDTDTQHNTNRTPRRVASHGFMSRFV